MNTVFTIGHSTRTIDEFIEIVKSYDITQLVDIRTLPGSRHNPQYGQESLQKSLEGAGISYVYIKKLGGLRKAAEHSVNGAWRNKSFRNYADYMQTDEFRDGLDELLSLSEKNITAILCAEAVPWRCHRSLVSDALVIRDIPVREIISGKNAREHTLTSFAEVDGTTITYPKSALKEGDE